VSGRGAWTGKGTVSENGATPEKLALLVELLPTALSFRDLAAMLGLHLDAVRREVAPILAIMKLNGTHPKCGCGRDRFHPYGCSAGFAKGQRAHCMPGHTAAQAAELRDRRELVIAMIKAGVRWFEIDAAFGLANGGARKHLRFMCDADREARKCIDAARRDETSRAKTNPTAATGEVTAEPAADHTNMRIAA
jgi:hypothetical protein